MLRLRPYKPCDADAIIGWCRDQKTYHLWGGELIGPYPLSAETLNEVYFARNGLCAEPDNFYPFMAFDGNEPVGHFIIRYPGGDPRVLRLGWVIVDAARRGQGIGRQMLGLGLKMAFEIMGAEKVTIGVYAQNESGYRCYRALGFQSVSTRDTTVGGETWPVVEMEMGKTQYFDIATI